MKLHSLVTLAAFHLKVEPLKVPKSVGVRAHIQLELPVIHLHRDV